MNKFLLSVIIPTYKRNQKLKKIKSLNQNSLMQAFLLTQLIKIYYELQKCFYNSNFSTDVFMWRKPKKSKFF